MDEIHTLSAVELARRIRTGVLTPVEAVERHIGWLQRVNPELNALVAERFAEARAEAREASDRLTAARASGSLAHLPPLLGVPFTVKEMISLEGMPHTFGCRSREGRRASGDATVIRRLRAAGAIALGVTNVPEWGFWFETDNLIYGRTRNPYDPSRISGGSSGGEAAAVAAGATPFGIGSDIGGSVRMPAGFCGVFGHKPTHGLLPLTGHYPVYADGPDAELPKRIPWLTIGPLARTADDLMPLLSIMAGPDGVDPNSETIALGDPTRVTWRGRRVLVLEDPHILGAARADRDVRMAVAAAARALAARGAVVQPLETDFFRKGLRHWFGSLRTTAPRALGPLLGGDRPFHLPLEFLRLATGRARFTFPALMFALMDSAPLLTVSDAEKLAAQGRRLADSLAQRLGEDGLLLMPVHPRAAPPHYAPYLRPFDFAYTAVLNVARVPATTVPVGLNAKGLPLAVQVAAARGGDHITIAAAMALEEEFGGWRPPERLLEAAAAPSRGLERMSA